MPRTPSDSPLPLQYRDRSAPPSTPDRGADVVRWLFPAYIFLILLSFFALWRPGAMPIGTNTHDRAVFQAVNAATLTGFQLSIHPSAYYLPGQVILFVLTVIGTLFVLIVGGLAVKRILRLPWPDSRLVNSAILLEAIVVFVGWVAGMLAKDPQIRAFDAVFQSAAAFANSGLYISKAGPPAALAAHTHLVLIPFSVLGGLGLTVLLELFDSITLQRPLSRHAKIVLGATAALYLIGLVAGILLQLIGPPSIGSKSVWNSSSTPEPLWRTILLNASFTTLNARTLGLPSAPVHSYYPPFAFLTLLMMMAGASPGGTGGGLKTTTLCTLLSAPRRILRGESLGRPFAIAATWLGLYLLALVIIHPLLLRSAPQLGSEQSLFLTISALSNVGLSYDRVNTTGLGLYLLSAAMFFGRITPLLILWWMADTTKDADTAIG